jgi:hypothetical protein
MTIPKTTIVVTYICGHPGEVFMVVGSPAGLALATRTAQRKAAGEKCPDCLSGQPKLTFYEDERWYDDVGWRRKSV